MTNWVSWIICGYIVLFGLAVVGIAIWRAKQAKTKPPLEFKLLRAPGESLRRRIAQFAEDGIPKFLLVALVPLLVGIIALQTIIVFAPRTSLYLGLTIVACTMLIPIIFAGRYCVRQLLRYRDDALGYMGERAVGEALDPLAREGFRVFHDVPAQSKGKAFNIDHVVVGENGVFAIETKTRRKGRARPGYEAHKVGYDGKELIWPWGEDRHGLDQASSRAEWLSDWLNKMTGLNLTAKPVLVLPGWYVVPKGIGPVLVMNHKQVPGTVSRTVAAKLTPEQVDLIVRQLDAVCRDVVD